MALHGDFNRVMTKLSITTQTARRFILGYQGLWPGRRWSGKEGVAQALRVAQAIQIDTVCKPAYNHELALWSRVHEYHSADLHDLLYHERRFFDYGGKICIYPIEELPFWRLPMQRRQKSSRWQSFLKKHAKTVERVYQIVQQEGPISQRSLMNHLGSQEYNRRKNWALALAFLAQSGIIMTHHREGIERFFALREQVIGPIYNYEASLAEAEDFFAHKAVRSFGLVNEEIWRNAWSRSIERPISPSEGRQRLDQMLSVGDLVSVDLDGKEWYLLQEDLPLLVDIQNGVIPSAWNALATTTLDEANILAPLEQIIDYPELLALFEAEEYLTYKGDLQPRHWKYYTLPILYDDRVIGYFESQLESTKQTLRIESFWIEDLSSRSGARTLQILAPAIRRLAQFIHVERIVLPTPDTFDYTEELMHLI